VTVTMNSDKNVTATFDLIYTLTMAKAGAGDGVISPSVGAHVYVAGTVVTLTAEANPGSMFAGWSGDATGTTSPVTVTMDGDKYVTATFDLLPGPHYTLTMATAGTGAGVITPSVGAHIYAAGTVVTLTAEANPDSVFAGWSGDAAGATSPVTVTMDSDKYVTATFDLVYTLTVAQAGAGDGVISPSVGAHVYVAGTVVTLTAEPNLGSVFAGWSGDAIGATSPVTVTMDSDKNVTATFDLAQHKVYLPLTLRGW
jgi:uncharacterized repeat protein (TIGR02543 family)